MQAPSPALRGCPARAAHHPNDATLTSVPGVQGMNVVVQPPHLGRTVTVWGPGMPMTEYVASQ